MCNSDISHPPHQDCAPYDKGAFRVELIFPAEYPFKPPRVTFKTKIYHPNIDEKGQVCLPIISAENWKPATRTDQGKAIEHSSSALTRISVLKFLLKFFMPPVIYNIGTISQWRVNVTSTRWSLPIFKWGLFNALLSLFDNPCNISKTEFLHRWVST